MQTINDNNIIVVVGDLGSGVNFIKNLLLLDDLTDWPLVKIDSRLDYFLNEIYPNTLKNNLSTWLRHEYKLRQFDSRYKVDIANQYADINTKQVQEISQNRKIIFLTHWPDTAIRLKSLYPNIKIVSVYSNTYNEVLWQVKTYIDKVGIENLQNFSFPENIDKEKEKYINQTGKDAYYKFNVYNMINILKERSLKYKLGYSITINELLDDSIDNLVDGLNKYLNLNISYIDSGTLHNQWKNLHYSKTDVQNFKWFEEIESQRG
jgi:hypothetical protein